MLTYKSADIKKLILNRICQIDDEIVNDDPEYRELLNGWMNERNRSLPKLKGQLFVK